MRARLAAAGSSLVFACALAAGCGQDNKDLFVVRYEAGADGDGALSDATPEVDPTLGGPCTEDAQCDDTVACTYDRCDQTLSRCRNTPDDAQCDDGNYCDGRERCVLRAGCTPGPVITCQDDDPCTIDRCVEATKSCEHAPRDVDGDGDPDDHCVPHRDCNDLDPFINSTQKEICGNFIDDNCNGLIDDQEPCFRSQYDDCSAPLPVSASGTYVMSTIAAKKDYTTSCPLKAPATARDVVVAITTPAGGDVEVWATAEAPDNEVSVAIETTCGVAGAQIDCGNVPGVPSARWIARSLAPGTTVYAIVTAQKEGAVDVKVDLRAGTTKPANESCAAPANVPVGTPFTVALSDVKRAKDLASDCDKALTGELTYQFTLAAPADVRIFASTLAGPGMPVVSMRDANCTDELRCRVGDTPPVFARGLAAGTHVFGVAGTTQLDASVLVQTSPPTAPPPNQSCATAPTAPRNTSFTVDLSMQEDAIKNGCLPGGPAAAYDLVLTEPSDVLVIGRFPPTESGAVSINGPGCSTGALLACDTGVSPVRVSKRNLPAGDYKIVVADEQGQTAEVNVLVRPTVTPTAVSGSDGCAGTLAMPAGGGFFTGDTSAMTADFDASCDAPGMPLGGARDQLLRLDLAQKQRVVFDMSGSFYTTLLDVRQGTACPGTEVPGACYVGFGGGRSFLDTTLQPGTYWVQVDGYSGDHGPWNLDVRVLAP